MRLLIVGRLFGWGGAERSLLPLAQIWAKQGHLLTLLLVRSPTHPAFFHQFPGTVISPTGSAFQQRFQGIWELWQAIGQADLVIATSELTPTYITWLLTVCRRKPMIADVQVCLSRLIDDSCHPIHNHLSRWIYSRIRYIRSVGAGVAEDLQKHYQVSSKQIVVINVPFDLTTIPEATQHAIPSEHEAFFTRPTIVAVGRLTSQKRFDVAIAALHQLRKTYAVDANLLILGEGVQRSQLEQQIDYLKLTDRVFLPGFVDNPYAYIHRAQVFLLSSDYEGFVRGIIDALAAGCPVVSTDCPSGPSEILEQGKWGLLVPTGDTEAIAEGLAQVLTQPDLAQQLRVHGLQRAQAFDPLAIAQQYQNLLQQALSDKF